MQVKASATEILRQAMQLKPSGTVEGAYNTIDTEAAAVKGLKERLERRANYLVSLGNALADPKPGVDVRDLQETLDPLRTTLGELSRLIQPIVEPLTALATTVKQQNDKLRDAIKAFIAKNSSSLAAAEIPHGFGPAVEV